MNSIYQLRDRALRSGRQVFDLLQLSKLAIIPPDYARVYASRLVKKGFAHRVREGVISLTDDPLIIATQLIEPSYISFSSALYVRDVIQQAPALVECVTTRHSFKLSEPLIEYHRIIPELFKSYERLERYDSYVWVATPEKALLDMVYFGLDYKLELKSSQVDREKLLHLGNEFGAHGSNRGKRVKKWVQERYA